MSHIIGEATPEAEIERVFEGCCGVTIQLLDGDPLIFESLGIREAKGEGVREGE